MNLKEFVQKTLEELTEGVSEAQKSCRERALIGATRSSYSAGQKVGSHREIEFDVALAVTESGEKGVKAAICVWGLDIGGGKTKQAQTETTHRIKFSVPVVYRPTEDARPTAELTG